MKLAVDYVGEVEYTDSDIFYFENGLYGFEDCKRFILVQNPEKELPFYYLVSLDQDKLMFVVTNPFLFVDDYDFDLADKYVGDLSIEDSSEISVYGMVVIPDNPQESTINLKAPLVLNNEKMIGAQCVLLEEYHSRHLLFESER